MKITKRQLRRVIKEEKAKLIAETKVRRLVRRKLREGMGGAQSISAADAWQQFPDAMAVLEKNLIPWTHGSEHPEDFPDGIRPTEEEVFSESLFGLSPMGMLVWCWNAEDRCSWGSEAYMTWNGSAWDEADNETYEALSDLFASPGGGGYHRL
jgi:hypothetical protein